MKLHDSKSRSEMLIQTWKSDGKCETHVACERACEHLHRAMKHSEATYSKAAKRLRVIYEFLFEKEAQKSLELNETSVKKRMPKQTAERFSQSRSPSVRDGQSRDPSPWFETTDVAEKIRNLINPIKDRLGREPGEDSDNERRRKRPRSMSEEDQRPAKRLAIRSHPIDGRNVGQKETQSAERSLREHGEEQTEKVVPQQAVTVGRKRKRSRAASEEGSQNKKFYMISDHEHKDASLGRYLGENDSQISYFNQGTQETDRRPTGKGSPRTIVENMGTVLQRFLQGPDEDESPTGGDYLDAGLMAHASEADTKERGRKRKRSSDDHAASKRAKPGQNALAPTIGTIPPNPRKRGRSIGGNQDDNRDVNPRYPKRTKETQS